ncbi:polysaccharide deacetylase family protein [Mycolicibacterium vaccae]|jgi:peptidoglycan/xylan/chitin deacetylase (PgdA/CDA1 family)|uniref:Polysaccharide deacetylase n=1 Tax=Mycolicibacterium vaccae ATCC 25954 TaxID=1194972 RepID=K0UIF4_MYCVA|nr:polysaccharide deacetylase family protein [Mycolicibacterium vaccae]EJZ06962.1 polysaccharide deacetylase [Mycolicibacterium vaccae ATCC 25954]
MTASIPERASRSRELAAVPLVWMYHSIAPYDEDPYEVTMTPQRFESQMRWLRRRGLRGVSMQELLRATGEGRARGLVGLTFDDGYQDFIPNALPMLQRYGYTATVFVLAGRLGGENEWSRPGPNKPLLTADEVKQIAEAGMEIGSHGLKHISLLKADDALLTSEVARSREILQELLSRPVQGFCYPYGYLDARVVEAARAAGYDYACAVKAGPEIGRHAIPRTLVHEGDTTWRLDAKRVVSLLTVGNRHGVRRYRGGH